MRVHDLAKELGLGSKELVAKLQELGVAVKSHMSSVDVEAVALLRRALNAQKQPPAAVVPAPEAAEPAAAPAAVEPHPASPKAAASPPEPPHPTPEPQLAPRADGRKVIVLRGAIMVRELAEQMGMKANQLIADLMNMNVFAAIHERVDLKVAQQVAEKHGFVIEHERKSAEQKAPVRKSEWEEPEEEDRPDDLEHRPPIVTFMGHIDHGKTSIMDRIRNASVAAHEAGGITQHIGAYTVEHASKRIAFIDTPGHKAFTAMRARGANITDVVVIVVAADDGIMPQTEEAIKHAQAAATTIMVAINKMDLPAANLDRVRKQLQAIGLVPEEWGGTVICCPVSALTGQGIDHLLEMILLQADVLELKANPRRRAQGYVIESRLEPGMGPTANVMVMRGTLHVGDMLVCGSYSGRVKALVNDQGIKVRAAGPATPVKCLGLSGVAQAGEEFRVFGNDRLARQVAEKRSADLRTQHVVIPKKVSLEELMSQAKDNKPLELRLILKCDTNGSVEAMQRALADIKSDKVVLSILLAGVGNITENDVLLASASQAIIFGFNVSKEPGVLQAEKREGVEIRLYSIIYEIVDQLQEVMTGLLEPEIREKLVGSAEVRQIFPLTKKGVVAGCIVSSGKISARCKVRVKRHEDVLFKGTVLSLRHFQESVQEMREGQECGVRLSGFDAYEVGDAIEFFEVEKVPQKL